MPKAVSCTCTSAAHGSGQLGGGIIYTTGQVVVLGGSDTTPPLPPHAARPGWPSPPYAAASLRGYDLSAQNPPRDIPLPGPHTVGYPGRSGVQYRQTGGDGLLPLP